MSVTRAVLCAGLVLGTLLAASPAEARFGKRSAPSEEKKDDKVHEATPVGEEDSDGDDAPSSSGDSSGYYESSSSGAEVLEAVNFFLFVFHTGNHLAPLAGDVGPNGEVRRERHSASLSLRTGLQGGPLGGGSGVDLFLGIEGSRFGVDGRLTGLGLPTDDGTPGSDTITLLEGHLTWALISQERMRLRAEAGVSSAIAPDVTFTGFSLGTSFEACLIGPLDVEARLQATPFPYRQLDASAALALHLGALVLRGGYRGMVLDDAGLVDGIVHRDVFGGPYFGLGLTF
ncbi:MAG: hypothetical protein JXB05_22665 [Myxococcaceae bacterium]|nr:hypothetical protein [Myxococcaceae bacterium]